jgi:hypothetical protein
MTDRTLHLASFRKIPSAVHQLEVCFAKYAVSSPFRAYPARMKLENDKLQDCICAIKIEAAIPPDKLDEVRDALKNLGDGKVFLYCVLEAIRNSEMAV